MTERNFWEPDPEDYVIPFGIGFGVMSYKTQDSTYKNKKDNHRWKILKEFRTYEEALRYAQRTYGVPRIIVE